MPADSHCSERHATSYRAYLIRLWKDGQPALWRASAQSVQSGEIMRFATLHALFAFLIAETDERGDDLEPAVNEK
jgi:hypothetical protein